jgi:hypothetical protein
MVIGLLVGQVHGARNDELVYVPVSLKDIIDIEPKLAFDSLDLLDILSLLEPGYAVRKHV